MHVLRVRLFKTSQIKNHKCKANIGLYKFKKMLNNLQREELYLFSQSFGISYGSHYGMNSAIKQQAHLPLCLNKPQLSILCLHLVVKLHLMTSLLETISVLFFFPYPLFVMWHLLIFLHLILKV